MFFILSLKFTLKLEMLFLSSLLCSCHLECCILSVFLFFFKNVILSFGFLFLGNYIHNLQFSWVSVLLYFLATYIFWIWISGLDVPVFSYFLFDYDISHLVCAMLTLAYLVSPYMFQFPISPITPKPSVCLYSSSGCTVCALLFCSRMSPGLLDFGCH